MTLPPAIIAVMVKSYVPGCVSKSAPARAYQIFGLSDLKNARSFPIHLPVTRRGTRSSSTVIKATDPCCSSFGCQNTFLIPWAGDCGKIGEVAPVRMINRTILRKRLMDCVLGTLNAELPKDGPREMQVACHRPEFPFWTQGRARPRRGRPWTDPDSAMFDEGAGLQFGHCLA